MHNFSYPTSRFFFTGKFVVLFEDIVTYLSENLHCMSKKVVIFFFLSISILFLSMSSGYEESDDGKAGYTGSPGELTCAKSNCHNSFALNSGPGSVTIVAPTMSNWQYIPGQSYEISVTVSQSDMAVFGLGFEALQVSGANAGTLSSGTGTHTLNATVTGNSRKNVVHLLDGGLTTGAHSFTFTWLAPSTAMDVTFYVAGNAGNDNGSRTGDYIYTTSQLVTPVAAPTAPTIVANGELLLCNGASVNLSVAAQTNVTFAWFDDNNTQVATGLTFTASATACYHVVASSSGGVVQSVNTVCTTASFANASFSGLSAEYCSDSPVVQLSVATPGGDFSGPGIVGFVFNPSAAGPGTHDVFYSVTNEFGCVATTSQTLTIHQAMSAVFTGLEPSYCANHAPVQLNVSSEGGVFSGDGMTGNLFNPSEGVGLYTIIYTVGEGSCENSFSNNVAVLDIPDASFTGLASEYCSSALEVALMPATAGGSFSGDGISTDLFQPSTSGTGIHEITYSVSNDFGCSSSTSQSVVIHQEVSAEFSGLNPSYCSNDENAILTPVDAGGVFSGQGISEYTFDASVGQGTYIITYQVGEGSCTTTSTQETSVLPIADASFAGLAAGYCFGTSPVILVPVNPGGTFSGNGVVDDIFSPSAAAIGENLLSYTVSAENGCVSSASTMVFVYESANSNFSGLAPDYCSNSMPVQLIAENAGGIYSGPGVADNWFDPALAMVGTNEIIYTVDFVGCASSTTNVTIVHSAPDAAITGLDETYCLNDASANLIVTNPLAIISGNGIFESIFSPLEAGIGSHSITCSILDINNCYSQTQIEVDVLSLPDATISVSDLTATIAQTGDTYQWIDCMNGNIPISEEMNQSFTATTNGIYAALVTLNGCSVTSACVEIIVTGIEESDFGQTFLVFPNPTTRAAKFISSSPGKLQIYNSSGQCLYADELLSMRKEFNLEGYAHGIYTIIFTSDQGIEVRKLLVGESLD